MKRRHWETIGNVLLMVLIAAAAIAYAPTFAANRDREDAMRQQWIEAER